MDVLSRSSKWTSVGILFLTNVLNLMDRSSVPGLLPQIEAEFNLNHNQSGLVQSAFVICFFCGGLPFGFLGDRFSRKWIMVFGICFWLLSSMLSTFMKNYIPFLIFRGLVGFGEAGFTTLAPTLLGDYYTIEQRPYALMAYYLSVPIGTGLGFIVAPSIAKNLTWRWGLRVPPTTLIVVLIIMVIFLKDPKRGESDEEYDGPETAEKSLKGFLDDLVYLWRNRSFVLMTAGFTCLNFFIGGLGFFAALFLSDAVLVSEEYGHPSAVTIDKVPLIFGILFTISGVFGIPLGTFLSYKFRDRFRAVDPLICALSLLLSAPFILASVLIPQKSLISSFVLLFLGMLFLNMDWAVTTDILLYVVSPIRRSTAEAVNLMISHGLGESGSPYIVGLFSDAFKLSLEGSQSRNPMNSTAPITPVELDFYAFQYAFIIPVLFEFVGGLFYLATMKFIKRDHMRAEHPYEVLGTSSSEESLLTKLE